MVVAEEELAEVVGSNPTRSIYFVLVIYGIDYASARIQRFSNIEI
jgi:hypothetical protein